MWCISSLVVHNIHAAAERAAAIAEMVRVLKPGGRVVICEILHTRSYARLLEEDGVHGVRRASPRFLFFGPVWTVSGTRR